MAYNGSAVFVFFFQTRDQGGGKKTQNGRKPRRITHQTKQSKASKQEKGQAGLGHVRPFFARRLHILLAEPRAPPVPSRDFLFGGTWRRFFFNLIFLFSPLPSRSRFLHNSRCVFSSLSIPAPRLGIHVRCVLMRRTTNKKERKETPSTPCLPVSSHPHSPSFCPPKRAV